MAAVKAKREKQGIQSDPSPTPLTDSLADPAPVDLRTPKKQDLRETIRKKTPSAPRKVKMILVTLNTNYTGPHSRSYMANFEPSIPM